MIEIYHIKYVVIKLKCIVNTSILNCFNSRAVAVSQGLVHSVQLYVDFFLGRNINGQMETDENADILFITVLLHT